MKIKILIISLGLCFLFLILAFPTQVFATAGGHFGGSVHTSITHTRSYSSHSSFHRGYGIGFPFFHRGYGTSFPLDFFLFAAIGIIAKIRQSSNRKSKYTKIIEIEDTTRVEQIETIFKDIQRAWSAQELAGVRNLYTDKLFEQHEKALTKLSENQQTNYTLNPIIEGLSRYREKENSFTVDIFFRAIDYTSDDNRNTIINGTSTDYQNFHQRWTFVNDENVLQVSKIKALKS
ncbi:TIM44-like domain-containing protein [Lactococcus nasutitermitis]|uniref:TIM44-like domain-containing protein n=1 Tax=Lactococcus nasutitermitis TaxID=1652957 RepID=A0ABV9JFP1_9LACT|nr:TIM44-like domain-containing protein [Lactococcus nasutitermitis]